MKALLWKEFRENRLKLVIGCIVLTIVGASVSMAYRFFETGIPGMGQIPPEAAQLFRKLLPDFSDINVYLFSQWFGKNLQQVGGILAVILLGGTIAGERELHTAIFLFSRPVSRLAILSSKVIILFTGLALDVAISTMAAVLGALTVGKVPGAAFILCAMVHSIIALLVFASLAMLFSVLVPDRVKAILLAGGTIIVLSITGQVKALKWLNPLALFGSASLAAHPALQLVPLITGIALIIIMFWLSSRALQRQEF
jgi:ABC-type transport system involved in multi-copper enzyme maturation permease subunit